MNKKHNRGSALILVVSVMLIVFATAAVSLNISRYEMLATNSTAANAGGYLLAEGGVMNAEKLFNDILSARFYSVAEAAYEKVVIHLTGNAGTDILFAQIFAELMDAEVRAVTGSGFEYEIKFNDAFETEYNVTVKIKYNGGVFEIVSVAKNIGTGVADKVIGHVEFSYTAGDEIIYMNPGEMFPGPVSVTVENAGDFRYRVNGIKKAFE